MPRQDQRLYDGLCFELLLAGTGRLGAVDE